MTIHNVASPSLFLIATRPAESGRLGQGRCFWKGFLMALLRALSVGAG
jgi:hypothetical protein